MTPPVQPVVLPDLEVTSRPMNDIWRVLLSTHLTPEERAMLARQSRIEGNQAGANILPGLAAGVVQSAGALPNWARDVAGSYQGDVLTRLLGAGPSMERLRQDSRQLTGANAEAKGNDLLEMFGNMAPVSAPEIARLLGTLTASRRAAIVQDLRRVLAGKRGFVGSTSKTPIIGYHGTGSPDIEAFDLSLSGTASGRSGIVGDAVYFSASPNNARSWAPKTNNAGVIEAELNLRNPLHIDDADTPQAIESARSLLLGIPGLTDRQRQIIQSQRYARSATDLISEAFTSSQFTKLLQEAGYDGVVLVNPERGVGVDYAVFDPRQIKITNRSR